MCFRYPVGCRSTAKRPCASHYVAESPSEFFLQHGVGAAVGVPRAPYLASLQERLDKEVKDDLFQGLSVEPVLLEGAASEKALDTLARARQADLIVAASNGHSAIGRLLLGSFTEKVIRHSSVPVLTVRPTDSPEWTPTRVVVPLDFSKNSKAVLPMVRGLWEAFHPTFLFVYVLDSEAPLLDVPPPMGVGFATWSYEETPARVRGYFKDLKATDLDGIVAEFTVLHGRHYREITKFSETNDADLIVLATHGWTGIDHFVMGSVAERVARAAPCSVLTVRPQRKPVAATPVSDTSAAVVPPVP